MLISLKEIRLLKKGELGYIPLKDGYRLEINEFKQVFISRGGKKKYHLTDKLLRNLCSLKGYDQVITMIKLLIKVEAELKALQKRIRKDSKAYIGINDILTMIHEME